MRFGSGTLPSGLLCSTMAVNFALVELLNNLIQRCRLKILLIKSAGGAREVFAQVCAMREQEREMPGRRIYKLQDDRQLHMSQVPRTERVLYYEIYCP
jgi:hypothetical protein